MLPLYFGPSGRRLFGVYHPAEGRSNRKSGIVLCAPLGHEYIRSHRAFRNLAVQLALLGYHVLKFDYFGTGDSAGDGEELTLRQCLSDVETAMEELKDTAGVSSVSLIGLRMGATLAHIASSRRKDVDTLMLWDPIPHGGQYLDQLEDLQKRWHRTRPWTRNHPGRPPVRELIGFPLEADLERELRDIELATAAPPRAKSIVVLLSEDDEARWRERAGSWKPSATIQYVPNAGGHWDTETLVHNALLPYDMLRTIVSLLS
jgi:pimeloyl-ACP methyl ester carboxylesterase